MAKIAFHSFEATNIFNVKQIFYHWSDVKLILKLNSTIYDCIPMEFIGKSEDGIVGISKQGLQYVEKYSQIPFNSNIYL